MHHLPASTNYRDSVDVTVDLTVEVYDSVRSFREMVCGMWYVVRGMWYVECGMWYVVCGMWYLECGMWSNNSWSVIRLECLESEHWGCNASDV